ncbi:hypothetical protein BDW69DRAFT_44785 [Aspergillus filifer]
MLGNRITLSVDSLDATSKTLLLGFSCAVANVAAVLTCTFSQSVLLTGKFSSKFAPEHLEHLDPIQIRQSGLWLSMHRSPIVDLQSRNGKCTYQFPHCSRPLSTQYDKVPGFARCAVSSG